MRGRGSTAVAVLAETGLGWMVRGSFAAGAIICVPLFYWAGVNVGRRCRGDGLPEEVSLNPGVDGAGVEGGKGEEFGGEWDGWLWW